MTLKDKIKQEIIDVLTQYEDRVLTGFLSLDTFKELAAGDLIWTLNTPKGDDSNIVLLTDINKESIDAFNELKKDQIITMQPCSVLVASTEGLIYKYPVADKIKVHKSPHWLPTLVTKGPKFSEK